jgi:hypothetical protein
MEIVCLKRIHRTLSGDILLLACQYLSFKDVLKCFTRVSKAWMQSELDEYPDLVAYFHLRLNKWIGCNSGSSGSSGDGAFEYILPLQLQLQHGIDLGDDVSGNKPNRPSVRNITNRLRSFIQGFANTALKEWQRKEADGKEVNASDVLAAITMFDGLLTDPEPVLLLLQRFPSTLAFVVLLNATMLRVTRGAYTDIELIRRYYDTSTCKSDFISIATSSSSASSSSSSSSSSSGGSDHVKFGSIRRNLEVIHSEWGQHNPTGFRLRDVRRRQGFLLLDLCREFEACCNTTATANANANANATTDDGDGDGYGYSTSGSISTSSASGSRRRAGSFSVSDGHDGEGSFIALAKTLVASSTMSCLQCPTIRAY